MVEAVGGAVRRNSLRGHDIFQDLYILVKYCPLFRITYCGMMTCPLQTRPDFKLGFTALLGPLLLGR